MNGFFISAIASLVGSAGAFMILRYLFSERIRQWSAYNEKWQALQSVIVCAHVGPLTPPAPRVDDSFFQKAKGLPLIILIRVSPFPPWVYSNSFFAVSEH
jgi:uncharacterized membrane protein YdjX (TVP38/TMEM64 family)